MISVLSGFVVKIYRKIFVVYKKKEIYENSVYEKLLWENSIGDRDAF